MVWLTDGKFSEEYFNYLEAKENGNLDKIPKLNKKKPLIFLINTNDFYKE